MPAKRDWQSMDRKLSRGLPLEKAAEQCGIPFAEAETWAKEKLARGELDDVALQAVAADALQTAVKTLKDIAKGRQRMTVGNNDDLEAAKALLSFAMNVRKVSGQREAAKQKDPDGKRLRVQFDLWDGPGNWELTPPST